MKRKVTRTPFKILIIIFLIIGLTQLSTILFAPNPEKDSWGKIIHVQLDKHVENKIIVIGETQDIASGQFIWLAFDSIDTQMCRPQKRVLRNTRFRTTIPSPDIKEKISLYVIDETKHKIWATLKKTDSKEVKMPPDTRRLDATRLVHPKPAE